MDKFDKIVFNIEKWLIPHNGDKIPTNDTIREILYMYERYKRGDNNANN